MACVCVCVCMVWISLYKSREIIIFHGIKNYYYLTLCWNICFHFRNWYILLLIIRKIGEYDNNAVHSAMTVALNHSAPGLSSVHFIRMLLSKKTNKVDSWWNNAINIVGIVTIHAITIKHVTIVNVNGRFSMRP